MSLIHHLNLETRSPRTFSAFFCGILLATAAVLVMPAKAHADLRTASLRRDAMVYRQPNDTAQILGKLHQGKPVKIYFPDRNGWYAVAFSQPIQGAKYGWVHAEDIDIGAAATAGSASSSSSSSASSAWRPNRKNWVALTLDLRDLSPSAFQTGIGEPSSSFFAKGFGLEFGHRISNSFGLAFKGFYYSFSQATTAQAGGTYGASGYGVTAGADLSLVNKKGFQLDLGAGVGLSINQGQNSGQTTGSSSVTGYQTVNVLSYPLFAKVAAREFFGNGAFGVVGELGYEIDTLSAVPIQTVSGSQSTADIKVGGLVISLGAAFQF